MQPWAPSRSLEILFQRLMTRFGWGMAAANFLQFLLRLLAEPSPQKQALVLSAGVAVPVWIAITLAYRTQAPSKGTSDAFAIGSLGFVALQFMVVTWFVRDPMRITGYFVLLGVAGVFVRRVRHYLLALVLILTGMAVTWWLAPPAPSSGLWLATQMSLTLAVGALIHWLMRQLLHRLNRLLVRLVESRRAVAELRSLIPICAACKSVRNDKGFWESVETYMERQTQKSFSHGLCPTCLATTREQYQRELDQMRAENRI